jgi:hypothetical protein
MADFELVFVVVKHQVAESGICYVLEFLVVGGCDLPKNNIEDITCLLVSGIRCVHCGARSLVPVEYAPVH